MTHTSTKCIALFGATGGTGSATVRAFMRLQEFQKPLVQLHLMVRSTNKLLSMIPDIRLYSNIHIWEGQLTDEETVAQVLRNANTIICALGENSNIPGCHVLQDVAASIIHVLGHFESSCGGEWTKPRLILLSSSTWNNRFVAHEPALVVWLLKKAFYHPYLDLRRATAHLAAVPQLLSLLLVQPSALVEEEASGMEISTDSVSLAVSYADLGEAFMELSVGESYNHLQAVGVSSKGGNDLGKYWWVVLSRIIRGIAEGYVPGYWAFVNGRGQRRHA